MRGGSDNFIVGPFLPSDEIAAHPNSEFTTVADDEHRLDVNGLFDQRGHTGRARAVVSSFAVADANVWHRRTF